MATKHIIWSNDTDQFTDEEIRDQLVENGMDAESVGYTDINEEKNFLIQTYLEDEKLNLNKPLQGRVLCIADLGLWNGRRSGYRILGANLNEVLTGELTEIYCDGKNIVATNTHHDGTNYYTFREIREDKNIDNLLAKIYNGSASSRDIAAYTKSLAPYVCEIYGWKYAYARKNATTKAA